MIHHWPTGENPGCRNWICTYLHLHISSDSLACLTFMVVALNFIVGSSRTKESIMQIVSQKSGIKSSKNKYTTPLLFSLCPQDIKQPRLQNCETYWQKLDIEQITLPLEWNTILQQLKPYLCQKFYENLYFVMLKPFRNKGG